MLWIERIPRLSIRVGSKSWSVWHTTTRLGGCCGIVLFAVLSRGQGMPWHFVAAVVAVNVLVFSIGSYVSILLTNERPLALLRYTLSCGFATATVCLMLGVDIGMGLDYWLLGMLPVLMAGRVACLAIGCCHGRIARWGVWYPWRAIGPLCSTAGQVVRLFPIQAVEFLVLAGLLTAGMTISATEAVAGTLVAVVAGTYGLCRFVLEYYRGDRRPYLWRMSEAQWTCAALSVGTVFLSYNAGLRAGVAIGAISTAAIIVLLPMTWRWLGPPPFFVLSETSLDRLLQAHGSNQVLSDGKRSALIDNLITALAAVRIESLRQDENSSKTSRASSRRASQSSGV